MAVKKTIIIEAKTDQAVDNIEDVNEALEDTGKEQEKVSTGFLAMGGAAGKFISNAITGFKGFLTSVRASIASMGVLKVAIAATGVGLLVLAFSSLTAALKGSEEGQNRLNKILGVTGALVGNLVDILADFGDFMLDLFSGDGKAIQAVKDFGQTVANIFTGIGSGILSFMRGDFTLGIEQFKTAFAPVVEGIKDAAKATKEFIKEQQTEAQAAAKVADMRAKADKIERDLLVERSAREQKIAELRLKSRQEQEFTAQERRAALLEAQELEDGLLTKELEYLELRAEAQTLENTFARSNKENLNEEANLRAAVNRQIASRTNQQRSTQRELNRIEKEIQAEQSRLLKEREAFEKEARDAQAVSKQEQRDLEVQKEAEKYDSLIQQAIEYYGEDSELAVQLTQSKEEKLLAIKQKFADEDQKLREEQAKRQAELDKEREAKDKEQADREMALQNMKMQLASQALNALQANLKQGSKASKAVAVAQATYDTYAAIQSTFASAAANPTSILFPAQPYIQAGIAAAFGFGNIKKILSTNPASPTGASSGIGAIPSNVGAQAPTTQFNTLQGGFNQLENAINSQNNVPQKAYVVTQDINNASQLDRKISNQSIFG